MCLSQLNILQNSNKTYFKLFAELYWMCQMDENSPWQWVQVKHAHSYYTGFKFTSGKNMLWQHIEVI